MHIQGHVCMCWQVLTAQCLHLPCEDTPKTHLRVEKKGWQGQNPCSEWPLPVACPVPKPQPDISTGCMAAVGPAELPQAPLRNWGAARSRTSCVTATPSPFPVLSFCTSSFVACAHCTAGAGPARASLAPPQTWRWAARSWASCGAARPSPSLPTTPPLTKRAC
eukprot:scaffold146536_cov18-Tisochrysis_lutea.AAC.2